MGWNEQILRDVAHADKHMAVTLLRYFNPVGSHESGLIGEDPKDIPNNLLPYVMQTAAGKREYVSVYGNDYDTPDGTGVRDYIHVVDLAAGHVAALGSMEAGVATYNLATNTGTSVLEMIAYASKACGHDVPYRVVPRRPGDIDSCYASANKAEKEIGWRAGKTVEEAVVDAWRWQSGNPNGYNS